ncbi:hypothetical protein B0H11DRAFT_1992348 [Mycena galericulata]|nr:hypothetical protein B0H11DRAFT_1992348 [Mycena galericulata]
MSQQDASSTLVAPGVLGPAVEEISTQIHAAQQLFVDAQTQFMLVNGSASAISNLRTASQLFTQFFLNTQTNTSTVAANIQTFHSQAVKAIANISSSQTLASLTFIEGIIAPKKVPVFVFTPIIKALSDTRKNVNTLSAQIDAARRATLDDAIKKVEDLQTAQEALKAQFSAALPQALKMLGMNSDSSSLTLYMTVAPASLLDSVLGMLKGNGGDLASGLASKGAEGEAAAIDAGTQVVEGVINSAVSTASLVELKEKLQKNQEDLDAAKLALERLKEDQAKHDQGSYLKNSLIYISEIKGAIAALSPQLAKLGTVYTAMDDELKAALALIKDAHYDEAKAGLQTADAVFTELGPALTNFATQA